MAVPEFPQPGGQERDVEEADIIKLVGDRMYVLNPYRGLLIVDLSDPDDPVLLGRANVLGTPVDLYVVGERAYVITSTSFNFWNQYIRSEYSTTWGDADVSYRLGSEIAIVDLSNPHEPSVIHQVGVEGYITDSRRVGEIIYFVSSMEDRTEWKYGTTIEGTTYVMSLDMADPSDITVVDQVSFDGTANHIHVTKEHIYVAQPYDLNDWSEVHTIITLLDISDPQGDIVLYDNFRVNGLVEDRYQMDAYKQTFRVVTHRWTSQSGRLVDRSEIYIFDVSDPTYITQLGHIDIGDAGELKATRFAGDRAYTIHLPRQSIDPLDVIDLSDPTNPTVCCILEIPGWVEHLEVRGYKILAIGVSDLRARNVAVTMFDVTDPYNAIQEDRVVLEASRSWSSANWDPKALTILDDDGLMLIPYAAYGSSSGGRGSGVENGVHIIEFDLEQGDLEIAGSYSQYGSVTRTRQLGDRIVSVSIKFLQVADVSNPYKPWVTATLELCPQILDVRVTEDYSAEIIRHNSDGGLALRIRGKALDDGAPTAVEMDIDDAVTRWLWNGDFLYLFKVSYTLESYWAMVTTMDISRPDWPHICSRYAFRVAGPDNTYDYPGYSAYPGYDNQSPIFSIDSIPLSRPYYYNYYETVEYDPLQLVDEELAVYVNGDRIHCLDLTDPGSPRQVAQISLNVGTVVDVRLEGRTLLVTNRTYVDLNTGDYYVQPVRYFLRQIDLTEPTRPRIHSPLNIPGTPIGVDMEEGRLYTDAYWLFEGGQIVRTINVVDLGGKKARISASINATEVDHLDVDGHHLFLTEYDSSQLKVDVYDLSSPRGVKKTDVVTIEGNLRSPIVMDGFMFVSAYSEYGMQVYSIEDSGSLSEVGFFALDNSIYSVQVMEDTAYVVQGLFGLVTIDLGSSA
jgi:hypothetical protein